MLRFAFALTLLASHVLAQGSSTDEEARGLFEAGRTAYDAGRFESALRYFQEAYDLSHRPALLFNIAQAADRLQDNSRALAAYEQYLAALPNAPNRELAQSRIEFFRSRLGGAPAPRCGDGSVGAGETCDDGNASSGDGCSASCQSESQHTGGGPTEPPVTPRGGDVTGEWWFWTLIAVLAVGAGVGITVGVVAGSGGGVEGPLPGNVSGTFTALTWGP